MSETVLKTQHILLFFPFSKKWVWFKLGLSAVVKHSKLQAYADMDCSKYGHQDSFTCKGETTATCFTEIMRVWEKEGM